MYRFRFLRPVWLWRPRSVNKACRNHSGPNSPARDCIPVPEKANELVRKCNIRVQPLPEVIRKLGTADLSKIKEPGLLYLPNPYVVPGGFFNEMYGWDSYFIIRGLVRAGKTELAQGMVENFFYDVTRFVNSVACFAGQFDRFVAKRNGIQLRERNRASSNFHSAILAACIGNDKA